ncbi:MAG: hypothetical protein DMF84_23915 [Acidobacteria bacterium]|nr:MAG: hypothetical protein DMF84_23915 [Acidobacteriota bacterium]
MRRSLPHWSWRCPSPHRRSTTRQTFPPRNSRQGTRRYSKKSARTPSQSCRASTRRNVSRCRASTTPLRGITEYQLDAAAHYVFKVNDARLEGYRSITASGTENISNMRYFRNTSTLKDGDLVLMDYAPDYRYTRATLDASGQCAEPRRRGSASCCSSFSSTATRSSPVSSRA